MRQSGTMIRRRIFAFINLHLTAATEVIATRDKDGRTEMDVCTHSKVLNECLIPVVQACQRSMQRER